jgi:hypothetical protein
VLVCGARDYDDVNYLRRELTVLHREVNIDLVIDGAAAGADSLAHNWALDWGIDTLRFPAQWDRYGRSAGPIRNRQMLTAAPDLVVAFHKNIAASKGTADMVRQAEKAGIPVMVMGG